MLLLHFATLAETQLSERISSLTPAVLCTGSSGTSCMEASMPGFSSMLPMPNICTRSLLRAGSPFSLEVLHRTGAPGGF